MEFNVKLTLTEEMLGTVPLNKEIYSDFVESKKPKDVDDEETDSIVEMKGETGFHCNDEGPFLFDYVIKGFFKDACSALRRATGTSSSKLTAYKKVIDGLVFITPRQLNINTNDKELGTLERPLRAQTAQGERVALAKSKTAPVGSTIEFTINVLGGVSEKLLKEWLDYGALKGLGQWRNAGYGRFTYTIGGEK